MASPEVTSRNQRAMRFQQVHARRLRALAYRMLGSVADAEDIVQEAWLRWDGVDEEEVRHDAAFLSRLVTNLCLDRLGSASARREHYVGIWLPEPWIDDEEEAALAADPAVQAEFSQDLSVAFLLMLERLSPLERAAFLLHDVFDEDFDEIALRLQRTPAACRQLASRARNRIRTDHGRRMVDPGERQRLFQAFSEAVRAFDVDGLARILTEDAVLMADGGGKASAVPRPLQGAAQVAKVLIGFARLPDSHWTLESVLLNGEPGCLVFDRMTGSLLQTITLAPSRIEPNRIGALYIQRNPDKLKLAPARR